MYLVRSYGLYVLLALVLLSGCGGGGGGGGDDDSGSGSQNATPSTELTADAGHDKSVKTGRLVRLDGSNSRGPANRTIDYKWSFSSRPNGSGATLADAKTATPSFTPDIDGKYVVSLTVAAGNADSPADQVTITSTQNGANSAPVADAGGSRCVTIGDDVALSGAQSSDADNDALSYRWQFASRPDDSNARLTGADTVSPSFTADVKGKYSVTLRVADGKGASDQTQLIVNAFNNAPPQADAGPDQRILVGSGVTLDGSATRDSDGDDVRYQWRFISRPADSNASLDDRDTVSPSFQADAGGTYVVELVASDDRHDGSDFDCATDRVIVTAATGNSVPVADAGPDQRVRTGATVALDGSDSRDANNDDLDYQWSFVSQPSGSQAGLSDADSAKPEFNAQTPGTYVLQLVVNDGEFDSDADRVEIVASQSNSAPVADAGDDQNVPVSSEVGLDGSGSSDADNDALTYRWRFVSRPDDSDSSLSDADTKKPTFTPDQIGDYVLGLVVNDGNTDSDSDQVVITAGPTLAFYADRSTISDGQSGSTTVPNFQIYTKTLPANAGQTLLTRFALSAIGRTFTITDVRYSVISQSTDSKIGLAYDGLSSNTTIEAGHSRIFTTNADVPNDPGIYLLSFNFNLKQTNTPFQIQYCLDVGDNDLSCKDSLPDLEDRN